MTFDTNPCKDKGQRTQSRQDIRISWRIFASLRLWRQPCDCSVMRNIGSKLFVLVVVALVVGGLGYAFLA